MPPRYTAPDTPYKAADLKQHKLFDVVFMINFDVYIIKYIDITIINNFQINLNYLLTFKHLEVLCFVYARFRFNFLHKMSIKCEDKLSHFRMKGRDSYDRGIHKYS